jgi:hypothetical protein
MKILPQSCHFLESYGGGRTSKNVLQTESAAELRTWGRSCRCVPIGRGRVVRDPATGFVHYGWRGSTSTAKGESGMAPVIRGSAAGGSRVRQDGRERRAEGNRTDGRIGRGGRRHSGAPVSTSATSGGLSEADILVPPRSILVHLRPILVTPSSPPRHPLVTPSSPPRPPLDSDSTRCKLRSNWRLWQGMCRQCMGAGATTAAAMPSLGRNLRATRRVRPSPGPPC